MKTTSKLIGAITASVVASSLPYATTVAAQDGAALFTSICSNCHNGVNHPRGLVYNAAGNVAIIEAVIAKGMGAAGSLADHTSIAAYLDRIKPVINQAPVAHDSAGTMIDLKDIIVSAAERHASWKIIGDIVTVSPPTKGTVAYGVANGFGVPSYAVYTPFRGQSGIDTWTYQGIGPGPVTTVRTASVNIADANGNFAKNLDLNQHGLTGSWYEPATSGQGILAEIFADLTPGTGQAFLAWFTYDTAVGGAERQRWYTLQGPVANGQPNASLTIYENTGGSFNAPPATNSHSIGNATLSFSTCTDGSLSYSFTDGSGREGTIPLTRLLSNSTCAASGPYPTDADFALSGSWYAGAATSGQGFMVDLAPNDNTLFLGWFTYMPNGANAGASGQRWYSAQGPFTRGMRSIPVQINETTGLSFDSPTPAGQHTVQVGTGTMAFQSCTAATFNYNFTSGTSAGSSGTISLSRIGPVPPGCTP